MTNEVTILYRPVKSKELALIEKSGWKQFPLRLTEHTVFYSAMNEEYATKTTRDWNNDPTYSVFVTKFAVKSDFLKKYGLKNISGDFYHELQIPAGKIEEFNDNIVGLIEVTDEFVVSLGSSWRHIKTIVDGERFELNGLNIWDYKWEDTGYTITVKHPNYEQQHIMHIYQIRHDDTIIQFAAGEFSMCVCGIYQQG
jgi:hypothetical protein